MSKKNQLFCPTCSEYVDLYQDSKEENVEYRCVYCGQVLETGKLNPNQLPGMVLAAEDSPLLREMMKDIVLERKLAPEIESRENGQDLITAYTKVLKSGKTAGALILDVVMPVMNGFFTAIAIRGVEKAFEIKNPAPIVFLSSRALDEDFQKVIKFCQPCYYLSKEGSDQSPDKLAENIENLVKQILNEKN